MLSRFLNRHVMYSLTVIIFSICHVDFAAMLPFRFFITIQVTMRTFKGIWFFMIGVKKYFFILQFFMFDLGGVWGEFFRSLVVTVMANHKITAIGYRLAQPKSLIPSRGLRSEPGQNLLGTYFFC